LPLYDGLTRLAGNVSARDLPRFFKSARFGVEGRVERTERPRPGVRILRDRWGVPHVYGRTRADVEFGAGWVTAEDRGLLLQLLRSAGRIAALDVPGIDAFSFALSGRGYRPSAHAEQQLTNSIDLLRATAAGRQMLADVSAYVAGINAYHHANDLPIVPWTPEDVAGMAALIGAVFGVGGGDEARRSMFLDALQNRLGAERGRNVFDDLREQDNPATTATIATSFQWEGSALSGDGAAVLDDGSLEPVTYGVATAGARRRLMSNALLIGRGRSASGRPLFVAGPQVGHFYPQLLMELDLHGGGIDARGAAFPGISFYVLLGRGKDFGWSLTSSTSDLVDDYVEQLCGDDLHYRYRGECREMRTFDAGVLLGAAGEPDRRLLFRTTVHGPVIGYATVQGQRVAISRKRSTRGRELVSGLAWQDLNTNRPSNARQFLRSAAKLEMSFNWFYADHRDTATFSSGRLPDRPATVIPGLPAWGTGEHEWRGFLSFARHPRAISPPSGLIVNWNNKPARSFTAADDQWAYGSVHRVELLERALASRRKHTLASVVAAMNRAATWDLRAVEVLPTIEAVLAGSTPSTALAGELLDHLRTWRTNGSSRLDADADGLIDDAGAAVMEAVWPRLATAVLAPALGDLTTRLARFAPVDDLPSSGNAWGSGWYGYVDTDLRTLLGERVAGAYRTRFCGAGDLTACRASLWAALDAAGQELVRRYGADRRQWLLRDERISYAPLLSASMRSTNRPTFQQVLTFGGHR
jgi:acyl-homoserine lactone acylase PvdQ